MVTLWFIFLFKAQKGQIHSEFLHWDEGSYPSNMVIHTSATNKSLRIFDLFLSNIRLMVEILHQLRLVVYPIIYRVLYIPGG